MRSTPMSSSGVPPRDGAPERLAAALSYLQMGWCVFPLHGVSNPPGCTCRRSACDRAGKHPRTARGFLDATTDPAVVLRWSECWPDSNLGIATGDVSGFWALDIDPRHGGDGSLDELVSRHGPLPETLTQLTGGGGRHLLFAIPGGDDIRNMTGILPGIDVRGTGGYIVGAPSRHASGRQYAWEIGLGPEDTSAAPPPAWLLAVLRRAPTSAPHADAGNALIAVGQRNDALFRWACWLRGRGLEEHTIRGCLGIINSDRCAVPLSADEVAVIAGSTRRYPRGERFIVPRVRLAR